MGNGLRYICMALGAILLIAGWAIISAKPVKQELITDVGGFVASEVIGTSAREGESAPNAGPQIIRRLTWREVVLQAATTTYAAGIAGMILGAALLGFGLPAPSTRREQSTKDALRRRPDLLMFLAAGFLLLSGLVLAATRGFDGGFSIFGYRSVIALAACGALTALMRRVKVVGLAGYYAGLLAAALIALNLLRLAGRAAVHGNALDSGTMLLILTAVGGLAAFIFIWRAIPGGLDRARLMVQLRRVAAGAGAAAIITGVCIFKSGVLPQQAVAEFTDPTALSETAIAVLGDLVKDERVEAILQDPEVRQRLIESDVCQELIAATLGSTDVAGLGENSPSRAAATPPSGHAQQRQPGGENLNPATGSPSAPVNPADLLNKLSTADIQKLLDAAGIKADATDARVQRKIEEYSRQLTLDDPRLQDKLGEILNEAGGEGAVAALSAKAPSRVPDRKATAARPSGTPGAMVGDQPVPQKEGTRITPQKFDLRVHATRAGGESGTKPQPPRPHGTPARKGQEQPPAESPASQEIMSKLAAAKQAQADGSSLMSAIIEEANRTPDALPGPIEPGPNPLTSATPEAQPEEPAQAPAGDAELDETIEPAPAQAHTMAPPPPPPDPDSRTRPTAIKSFIQRATLAADRIGLIAMAIGAAAVLAAVLLRRFHRLQPDAESAER